MSESTSPAARLIPVAVCFSLAAVVFAGLGGLSEAPWRTLYGMGAVFCLIMLVVFAIMGSQAQSRPVRLGLAVVGGALVGVCHSLYFDPGGGLVSLLLHILGWSVVAFLAHLKSEVRSRAF